MNEFTKGEYNVGGSTVYVLNIEGVNRISANVQAGFDDWRDRTRDNELVATAELFAAAGTAATALAESGYDAVEVFRALPDVMKALERCDCYPLGVPTNSDLLRRIKGE